MKDVTPLRLGLPPHLASGRSLLEDQRVPTPPVTTVSAKDLAESSNVHAGLEMQDFQRAKQAHFAVQLSSWIQDADEGPRRGVAFCANSGPFATGIPELRDHPDECCVLWPSTGPNQSTEPAGVGRGTSAQVDAWEHIYHARMLTQKATQPN